MTQSSTSRSALVVEDERALRQIYAETLEDMGFEVHEAADADEALSIVAAYPSLDLVLSDVQLPGSMDGIQLVRRIINQAVQAKVVLMSGNELGADGDHALFLLKPFTRRALAAILN